MQRRSSSRARKLREEHTKAESVLWRRLRSRQINGRKWRRQQPIDGYVVDFFCPELRLVLEIDGDTHAGREAEDAARQAYLETQGLIVIRFTNNDVSTNLSGVLERIWEMSR